MQFHTILKTIPVAIVLLTGCGNPVKTPAAADLTDAGGFVSIFNGKDLEGWDGEAGRWRVEEGVLIGEITPEKPLARNTFLLWKGGQPADFELKLQFRIAKNGNSGINYRSERVTDTLHDLKGYQADLDGENRYTGQNYDEHGRTTLAYRGQRVTVPAADIAVNAGIKDNAWAPREVTGSLGEAGALKAVVKAGDWNTYRVVAKGGIMQHYVNGALMSEVTDNDTANRKLKGWLGLQVHSGPPTKVEFRDIRLKQ